MKQAIDLMKIKVAFKKGNIYCSLQSLLDRSLKNKKYVLNGLLNRQLYLKNTFIKNSLFPDNIYYKFDNNQKSLHDALKQILYDLNSKGKIFVCDNDQRFEDPRFIKGMQFIESLNIEKESFKNQFYKDSEKAKNSIPKNKNPIFCHFVDELNRVKNVEPDIENYMIAFEFLHKFMFEK